MSKRRYCVVGTFYHVSSPDVFLYYSGHRFPGLWSADEAEAKTWRNVWFAMRIVKKFTKFGSNDGHYSVGLMEGELK
jgi:hypothetical protein